MNERIAAYSLRQRLLADRFRPGYHFASPGVNCMPGDPNGAFFADGRYHLMYLYRDEGVNAYAWGHISSADLLHWRSHPDALREENGDEGCFSGGAFVDEDGTAYLTFWKFPSKDYAADCGGIDMAFARPPYDVWQRMRPIAIEGSRDIWGTMELTDADGKLRRLGCADPSNIWKQDGHYYMQLGNKVVLDNFGTGENGAPEYQGDWTELFRSEDLKTWRFVHRFYRNPHLDADYPDETEDDMCPSFLPLNDRDGRPTGKWLQLFISHNKGAQYYIGTLRDETFFPETHGRFTWVDNTCFAPETLMDDRGRQLAWFWFLDDPKDAPDRFGWAGVYTFPRELWLEDGVLHMAPARELEALQRPEERYALGFVPEEQAIPVSDPVSFRLKAELHLANADRAGFVLARSADGSELCRVYVDKAESVLAMETIPGRSPLEKAPIIIENDRVSLDILVDHAAIEVFADCRQAISRRYFGESAVPTVAAMGGTDYGTVSVWAIHPSNPF